MRTKRLACLKHFHWHPNRDELRRFAVSTLVGFGVLGTMVAWRNHHVTASTFLLWSAGVALALGAMTPPFGRAVYLAVYLPATAMGYVVSHLILMLLFFVVFLPLGLLLRLTGQDLLLLRHYPGQSMWTDRALATNPNRYYHPF